MTARPLGYGDLALCLLLVAFALGLSWRERLGLGRALLVGTARTFLQLSLVGYALGWVFHTPGWYWTALFLGIMLAVAVHTAVGRQEKRFPGLLLILTFAIAAGTLLVLI